MVKESSTIESAAKPAMVNVRYIGAFGATSRTIARISGPISSARGVLTTYAGDETLRLSSACPTSGR